MFVYIIWFFCLFFGVMLGIYIAFLFLKPKKSKAKFVPRERHVAAAAAEPAENIDATEFIDMSEEQTEADKKSLKEKLDSRTSLQSMVSFNCAADKVDYDSYLLDKRDKQDDAYNVMSTEEQIQMEEERRIAQESLQRTQDAATLQAAVMNQQMMNNPPMG